jgi:glutathione S-transferase
LPELYDNILSDRCYSVRLFLGVLGVAYTKRTVDYAPAKSPASSGALRLNPEGEIPILVDDGRVFTNITSILLYLAEHYDPARAWLPRDSTGVLHWVHFAAGPLSIMHEVRKARLFMAPGTEDNAIVQSRSALRSIEDHLTDQSLAGHDWIIGDGPTLADIAVFPSVALSHDCGIGHEDYPAINLWQRRVRRLSGFVSTPGIPDYF